MGAWNEFYEKLCTDYGLNRDVHFWLHRQSGKYVILHSAVKVIAKKDGIKCTVLQLDETSDGKSTHMLSGAVAWVPGDEVFTAWGTRTSMLLTGPDEDIEMMPDLKFKMRFKAKIASAEVGEGDSSNYQAGYKRIIVDKRAYDRAVLEIIQHKYEYNIFTDQDAEVMDGVSESEEQGKSEDRGPVPDDSSEIARYSKFRKQVQQWIKTVGVDTAKNMVVSSLSVLDTITKEHRDAIYTMIDEAEKLSAKIVEEKAEEEAPNRESSHEEEAEAVLENNPEDEEDSKRLDSMPEIEDSELTGISEDQIATTKEIAIKLWSQEKPYHLKTVVNAMMPSIKELPEGPRAYLTRVRRAKSEYFERRKEK